MEALSWLALALMAAAMTAAAGVVFARSLFAMCMHLAAAGASVAAAIVLLEYGEAGLAAGLVTAAWTPVLLLSAMLLSARAAKPGRRGWPVLSAVVALGAFVALCWPLAELGAQGATPLRDTPALAFWLAPLVFVAVVACMALLGYGERGALATHGDRP